MTSDHIEEISTRFHQDRDGVSHRPIVVSPPASMNLSKPRNSPRFIVVILQVLVMAVALLLFFLFAGIAAVLLLHLFVAGRALRRRRHFLHEDLSNVVDGPGMSQAELRKLPCSRYLAGGQRWDCAICLEGIREGDRCRLLSGCKHTFHKACVDKWLVRSRACPICRTCVNVCG